MAAHPHDHLDDQRGCHQHHGGLEVILSFIAEQVLREDQHGAERHRRHEAHHHATPEVERTTAAALFAGLVDEPGVKDADDEQRLDGLAPHDQCSLQKHETGAYFAVILPCGWFEWNSS